MCIKLADNFNPVTYADNPITYAVNPFAYFFNPIIFFLWLNHAVYRR